jgi:hypothetical protein
MVLWGKEKEKIQDGKKMARRCGSEGRTKTNWLQLDHEERRIAAKCIGVTHQPLDDMPFFQTHMDLSDEQIKGAKAQIKRGK